MKRLNNYLEKISRPIAPISFWLLRFGLGVAFFLHGFEKFPLPPEKMTNWFTKLGFAFPELTTSAVALGEVGAGVGIILGGLVKGHVGNIITKVSGGAVVVIMSGAFIIAHPNWFFTSRLFMSEQIFLFILGSFFLIRGNNNERAHSS
tara:strand:+ start:955 stop:1398 length:444 start_codon:yes stop_codon:yes gene_type:complete